MVRRMLFCINLSQYLHFLANYTSNIQLASDIIMHLSMNLSCSGALHPCLLSSSGLRITPPSHHSKVIAVSVRNRMAGRRGQENACAWQTWQGYYLHVLSWSSLTLIFSGLLQKDLLKGKWSLLKKVISNKIIVTLVTQGFLSSFLSCPVA